MTLADSLAVSVSVPAQIAMNGATLVEIFSSGNLNDQWVDHVGGIFLECPLSKFTTFLNDYGISLMDAQIIYEKTPAFYHNREVEELLYGNMGKVA